MHKLLGHLIFLGKDEDNLITVYYCGYGIWVYDGSFRWKPNANSEHYVDWEACQTILPDNSCDWLFILDCCCTTRMILDGQNRERRCEVLGACNALDEAFVDYPFTPSLCRKLVCGAEKGGISTNDLYWTLSGPDKMDKYSLKQSTQSSNTKEGCQPLSVSLISRSLEDLKAKSSFVMLIAAHLRDNQYHDFDAA